MSGYNPEEYANQIASDLAVFADIGTPPPDVEPTSLGFSIRLIRHGETSEIELSSKSDALIEHWGEGTQKYANLKALLASDRYGNLRDWASKQSAFFDQEMREVGDLIDLQGNLNDPFNVVDVDQIDHNLISKQKPNSTRVLLIDGPAGIGKTQFISLLSGNRAKNYISTRRPLILHVQSRGRTLSYLYDLIAFSLQKLRIEVTFDQVPVLAKHGLVTLSIDGFDELADPDGYDNAWAQVSDLIKILRGSGSIILSGRETFIGRDRVLKDISSLRADIDEIDVLTLRSPSKTAALNWLSTQGWDENQTEIIEGFLEPNSLALRPFFLKTLVAPGIASRVFSSEATSVLSILMDAMVEREVGKFGEAVERELTPEERRAYLISLLSEAARDMAESNSSSISDVTLSWLVDMALPKAVDESVVRILKARSQAIAFFTNDDRRGYRRFFHDKFFEYFLSLATVEMISESQAGKILSRNILGSSFLETFGDVIGGNFSEEEAKKFCSKLMGMFATYPPIDRTRRNLGAIAVGSLSIAEFNDSFVISDIDLDDCRFAGTASGGIVRSVVISQFDCRGANLSATIFADSAILSLIADKDTLLPDSFPVPLQIKDISLTSGTIFAPDELQNWVREHLENQPVDDSSLVPADLREHPAVRLLQKACRSRQYWLRRSDDVYAMRILNDEWWKIIETNLSRNNLLKVEMRPASGTDGTFIHIKYAEDILDENLDNDDVVNFYRELTLDLAS